MVGKLFLLFAGFLVLDLYLLIQIGERLGGVATLALVLGMGMLGATLARAEGLRVVRAWQDAIRGGTVPADGVVSGALVLLGGVLLIVPGVLSDVVGLLLLVPFARRPIARYIARRLAAAVERGSIKVVRTHTGQSDPFGRPRPFDGGDVIDVEGESVPSPRTSARQLGPSNDR